MQFHIANGYRLNVGLPSLMDAMDTFREQATVAMRAASCARIARYAHGIIDSVEVGRAGTFLEQELGVAGITAPHTVLTLAEDMETIWAEVNFAALDTVVRIYRLKNGTLLAIFCGSPEVRTIWRSQEFVSEYNYYETSDGITPPFCTSGELRERARAWEEAIPDAKPYNHGLMFEHRYSAALSKRVPAEMVLQKIPAKAKRAERVAIAILRDKHLAEHSYPAVEKFLSFLDTEEGQAKLEAITKDIYPRMREITRDTLEELVDPLTFGRAA